MSNNNDFYDDIPVLKKDYFVMTENAFINNPKYTPVEKMVYQCLCTFAGKHKSCFPGQNGIAKNLGITRPTVNAAIKSLQEKGGLLVINQITESKRKTTNTYILSEIDKKTGLFDTSSLDEFRCLVGQLRVVKGK